MDESELRLDGNAAAGVLAEIFGREMTTAEAICAGCGADGPISTLIVYDPVMGIILRCPACGTAMLRISRVRSGYWLDVSGTRILRIQTAG